jgi:hypothetical protein
LGTGGPDEFVKKIAQNVAKTICGPKNTQLFMFKKRFKSLRYFSYFQMIAHSKQSPNSRKFAKSVHPRSMSGREEGFYLETAILDLGNLPTNDIINKISSRENSTKSQAKFLFLELKKIKFCFNIADKIKSLNRLGEKLLVLMTSKRENNLNV